MVFGPSGLVATIVTLNPAILLASVIGAALLAVPLALLLYGMQVKHWKLLLVCFFVGGALATHVVLSRLSHLSALDVEVVKVWGGPDETRP